MRPSVTFAIAFAFYQHTTGRPVTGNVLIQRSRPMTPEVEAEGFFRSVYRQLAEQDKHPWSDYWKRRLLNRGLDVALVDDALQRIPSSTPQ
eukprot:11263881-Karenia_brevis.AAC.1